MIQQRFFGKTPPNLYRSGRFILQVLRCKLRYSFGDEDWK
jgi:hypothetical protein